MSDPQQLSLDIGKPHRNHYLFSDHYLDELLRREAIWRDAQPQAAQLLAFLRQLYAREGGTLDAYSEAQLEEHWIKPILGALGHVWEPQAAVPGLDRGIKKPDYVFFSDAEARQAAAADQRREEYARHALAVGEVKAWPVNLSKKTAGAAVFDNNNPMFQIDYYLKSTGVAWGIASNGRFWRLVHRDSSYRLDVYFELDLLDALTTAEETRALAVANYFVVLFGQAAFRPDAGGAIRLDGVLRGSQTYARALESDLRDNAYKALEQLIIGFFDPKANKLDPHDPADRDAVYRHSLLLLYRLLFLFYGESRGLLPMGNEAYRERSLTALSKVAARAVDDHKVDALPPMSDKQWGHLRELFTVINGDNVDLNTFLAVPRYNGGLFDPQRHPFLAQKFVGDRHLIRALDYLARRRKTDASGKFAGFEAVDYRTLGVRQLGSIYEGLLEYRVSVAEEEMVTVRKGGKETWLPARERGKGRSIETKEPGELYLATDKGERKATGSYYTPDYIVKYIVEQTLGPLVEEARERVKSRVREVDAQAQARRESQAQRDETSRRLAAQYFEEEILALNVLDPAMGSGHFLVDATDFLARALATDEYVVGAVAEATESDLTYWRRRVVEACIYGVDKNELAVELAKLSLWLVTVAADKPLSFLDHHLRHGDSLIGAWLKDLDAPPRPVRSPRPDRSTDAEPLFDESAFTLNAGQAVGGAARIEAILTDDLDAVHDKERILGDIRDTHLGRWRRLADLWVSAWFGNGMSAAEYRDLARRVQGRPSQMSDEQAARYLTHPAATANDYFHWELEFPEVFFDAYGRPKGEGAGFDAVIGNPPYVRQEVLTESSKQFYETRFIEAYHGAADIYVYFLALGISTLKSGRRLGLICSSQFCRLNYGVPIREHLTSKSSLKVIVEFGKRQVFEDATTYPIVLVTAKELSSSSQTLLLVNAEQDGLVEISEGPSWVVNVPKSKEQWVFVTGRLQEILASSSAYTPLTEVLVSSVNRGVTTGLNDAFVIDRQTKERLITTDPNSAALIKPYIRGEDLHRWYQDDPGLFLIFTRRGTDITNFPAIAEYLEAFRERLEPKPIDWDNTQPWAGRKAGRYQWFEIQDSVEYFPVFETPRIHSTKVSLNPSFSFREDTLYASNTSYVIPVTETDTGRFVLAVLNSRLSNYYCRKVFAPKANGYYEVQPERLDGFPFPSDWQNKQLPNDSGLYLEVLKVCAARTPSSTRTSVLLDQLAAQMLALHQVRQTHTADFWTDLEGVTPPPTFRKLRDKGKQEAGLAAEAALAPFVRAASHSTRTLDDALAWDEAAFKAFVRALAGKVDGLSGLVKVYQRYAPRYGELVERIARTDWLIDQIVYKLYGLTDEEIAIVEGRA